MELPTYTNIWKIEKRLYKLYDFRLPTPLPVGQVAAFLAIAIPYLLILTAAGMPFSHTWVWLYVLPPGVLTWLVTRPVLEGKRLPELVLSQARYLNEPRTWCRMAPLAEDDQIVVVARVWRRPAGEPGAGAVLMASADEDAGGAPLPGQFTPLRLRPQIARDRVAPIGYTDSGSGRPVRGLSRRRRGGPAVPAYAAPDSDVPESAAAVAEAEIAEAEILGAQIAGADETAAAQAAAPGRSAAGLQAGQPSALDHAATGGQRHAEQRLALRIRARGEGRGTIAATPATGPAGQRGGADPCSDPDEAADRPAAFRPVWPSRPAMSSRAVAITRTEVNAADALGPAETPQPEAPQPEAPRPETLQPEAPRPETSSVAGAASDPASQPRASLAGTHAQSSTGPESPLPRPVQMPERPAAIRQEPAAPADRPSVSIQTSAGALDPLHVVERALRTSAGGSSGWHDRVVLVPGGHRPGQPDQVQRDQARARLPLSAPARIVVIGCTAGAGQTVTTLLAGQLMASLRAEPVGVLDLGAGDQSLTELARQVPRLVPGRGHGHGHRQGRPEQQERGLQVVTADGRAPSDTDAAAVIETVAARYPLLLTDPAPAFVPRAVHAADQLVLVAPAGANAAGALAMTLEWLDTHGKDALARTAVVVLNGVSAHTEAQVAKAAAVAAGRCRAVLRVPWDVAHGGNGALSVASLQAYLALAGVLVAGLSGRAAAAGAGARGGSQ